jgi:hypothetical protein
MRNRLRFLNIGMILFAILALIGCETAPSKVQLSKAAVQNIQTIDAYIFVKQDEIHAEIDPSNVATYTGGGLIPALIGAAVDNSRAKKAEELVKPIRNKMVDYDYAELIKSEIAKELSTVPWLKINSISLFTGVPEKDLQRNLINSSSNALLVVGYDCYFSHDFKALNISGKVHLIPKPQSGEVNFKNCMYKNSIIQSDTLKTNLSSKESAAAKWAEGDADLTKKAIDKMTKDFAKKLVADLNI